MSIPVVIAENHEVTRWGMETTVEHYQGTVEAAPKTGPETLTAVEKHKPRVLILSLDLPRLNGFEVLRHLDQRLLALEIMVLTTREDPDAVRTAFELGVTSYMLKSDSMDVLGPAFEATVRGERTLSPALPEGLEDTLPADNSKPRQYRTLTTRQREVLTLTAEGYTGREVGEKLDLSRRTVEEHRRRLREKLGLNNVAELTRYAVEMGFYETPASEWLRDVDDATV